MIKRALLNRSLRQRRISNRIQSVGINAPYGFSANGTSWNVNYANWPLAMPSALKTALLAAGFTDIRLYVDPLPLFLAANDAAINTLLANGPLIAVADLIASGFNVTFDFHIQVAPSSVAGWGDTDMIDGTAGPKFTRLVHCATLVCQALFVYGNRVRFELFNEPPNVSAFTGTPWATQLTFYYNALRAVAPTLTLIVSPMQKGDIGTLIGTPFDPTPFNANTLISIHDYTPTPFCFQDLGLAYFQYINRLAFPPGNNNQTLAMAELTAADFVNADTSLSSGTKTANIASINIWLSTYFSTPQNVAWLQARLTAATGWADAHGVARNRLVLGEFGAVGDPSADNTRSSYISPPNGGHGADVASRAAYYNTVAFQCRALGIGFSVHVLEADSFEITNGTQTLVPSITSALFNFAAPVNTSVPQLGYPSFGVGIASGITLAA